MAGGGSKTSTTNANTSEDRLFVYTNLVLACNPPPSLPVSLLSLSLSIHACVYATAFFFFLTLLKISQGKKKEVKKETGLGLSAKKDDNFGEWYSEVPHHLWIFY